MEFRGLLKRESKKKDSLSRPKSVGKAERSSTGGKDCPMGSLLVNGGRNASLTLLGGDGSPGELMCH